MAFKEYNLAVGDWLAENAEMKNQKFETIPDRFTVKYGEKLNLYF